MATLRPRRIRVNIPISYTLKGNSAKGVIADISKDGIGIEIKQVLLPNDLLRLRFKLPNAKNIDCWGIIKNTFNNFIGVCFEEISIDSTDILIHYIENLLAHKGLSEKEQYRIASRFS